MALALSLASNERHTFRGYQRTEMTSEGSSVQGIWQRRGGMDGPSRSLLIGPAAGKVTQTSDKTRVL